MQRKLFYSSVCAGFVLLACIMSGAANPPSTEQVIHSFTGGLDGSQPASGLTRGSFGTLYGSTFYGGSANQGTVYKISRNSGGGWTETVLYNFTGGTTDGANPDGNLLLGPKGTIFGTTVSGGLNNYGVLFVLIPSGTTYTRKLLHTFPRYTSPTSGLVMDASGNLYGESGGGAFGFGAIYEMERTATGFKYVTLHSFAAGSDGDDPFGGLILDSAGNLYGTTASGGTCVCGDVFELKKGTSGTYTESILYTFTGYSDGVNPESALALDSSGNLFGTTVYGGDTSCGGGYGCGEVFELTNSGGVWTKTTLHSFTDTPDGHAPLAGVTFSADGDLFGTTSNGGTYGTGALYELSPSTGAWAENVLYSFSNGSDGGFVSTPVIFDAKGNLFGTAGSGGTYGFGVAYAFPGMGAQ